ncbi:hypothetical protein RUM43_002944 [Polyplax serrata]|uniref:Ferritin n=1 Tax=Polyplax serrata TaxID=468196 RepID=A0AAN8PN09_POLSC
MKITLGLLLVTLLTGTSGKNPKLTCSVAPADIPAGWITMTNSCATKMKTQVQTELEAAMTYMAMGAHFHKDSVNRPGFGDMFFKSANEEREHAMKLIEYLLMRGELREDLRNIIQKPMPLRTEWPNAVAALKDALNLETKVTEHIRSIVATCENSPGPSGTQGINDYHLVDYLTSDFLDEQHKGQRELAGHLSNLGKLIDSHGVLGEFLYDKKLLDN